MPQEQLKKRQKKKKLYINKLDNLEEMDTFLKKKKKPTDAKSRRNRTSRVTCSITTRIASTVAVAQPLALELPCAAGAATFFFF